MIYHIFFEGEQMVAYYSQETGLVDAKVLPNEEPFSIWDISPGTLKFFEGKEYKILSIENDLSTLAKRAGLEEQWEQNIQRNQAIFNSIQTSHVFVSRPVFKYFPRHILEKYLFLKCELMKNWIKPINLHHKQKLAIVCKDIETNVLNISKLHGNHLFQRIRFNPFGGKTGRFVLKENSFPIMNLKKEERFKIIPNNDFFLEIDYNAIDIRSFLFLCGIEQPLHDPHEWHRQKLFPNFSRQEVKQIFFKWLYGGKCAEEVDTALNKLYCPSKLAQWKRKQESIKTVESNLGVNVEGFDMIVTDPFGESAIADERRANSYLMQRTSASIFSRGLVRVWEMLRGKRSKIVYAIHDSVVIDFAHEDEGMIGDLKKAFENCELAHFKANVKKL